MYLERVNGPQDIKTIPKSELHILADETRAALIHKLSYTGGHVGSNLGVVELSVALHYVFDSPKDKIVWDVSHQCYPHKILTGRKRAYLDEEHFSEVTGFTNPKESEHDLFTIGHSSTSISLAMGLAKSRDTFGSKDNVVAIIGDGALSGGECYEGFNTAGAYKGNLIVIVNDNEQSVAENHGGIYDMLKRLREDSEAKDNLFKAYGLDYIYLEDGHDTEKLVDVLESVKDIDHPVVVHIHTIKGKGLPYAEEEREEWHSGAPFNVEDGTPKAGYPTYDTTVYDSLVELLENDDKSIVLTAATPRAIGFVGEDREKWAATGRFVDVGIAEENAMAMASGIARYGGNAVFAAYASFLQRTYDQLSHDVCLNNSPATILVLLPGAYGMKSNTHIGMCDIPEFTHIPNLVYLSPADKEEYLQMFKYATSQREHPVAIRVPVNIYSSGVEDKTDYSVLNKAKVVNAGSDIAIIAVGTLIPRAMEVAKAYRNETGKELTVINPLFLTGIDTELLEDLKKNHRLVITIEDSELDGGYGSRIASYYGDSDMKVKTLGITKAFHTDFKTEELLDSCGMSVDKLMNYIEQFIKK